MAYFFRMKYVVTVLLLMCGSLSDGYGYYKNEWTRRACQPCGYYSDEWTSTPCQPYGYYSDECMTPECCECSCNTGYISAELLIWRPFLGGLNQCIPTSQTDTVTPGGQVVSSFIGKGRDPLFLWNPGFRVSTGSELFDSNSDLEASWTHFQSHATGSRDIGDALRWDIDFDLVDLTVGYDFELGHCSAIRPFGGLRGAGIIQKLTITGSTGSVAGGDLTTLNVNNKETFYGIGPLIGLEADWKFWRGFSLYSSVSFSWLYGEFNVKLINSEASVDALNSSDIRKDLNSIVAGTDASVGIRWRRCFIRSTQLILQIGLEHHQYYDFNRMGSYGDLSFDGLNFSAAIEF